MTRKQAFNLSDVAPPIGKYVHVNVVDNPGRLIFLSGAVSATPDGKPTGIGDIGIQTRQVLHTLKTWVEAAGGGMEDITAVTVYVTDMKHLATIHKVRAEFWPDPSTYPSSTLVQVTALVHPDYLIEINAIAVVDIPNV